MLRLFMKWVLGGQSNKREATLFAFLISVGWDSYIFWKVGEGVDMSPVIGLASTVTVITFTGLLGATTLDHLGGRGAMDKRGPGGAP
ncbi:hypothetical protein KM176_05685 [Pseudooceanicola sp. CBS1P-1]|uniref:Uncharacterized protein n=1 Tax=Pseudooceanicola albus TaxID=2692189 RepID=A0A6L7G189_9RHOB|nr:MULTISPECIES: hypothetical protein [Pseudooceanicola]MBT9383344.1 hypothetical protein [Pseudooceanicola endophyticus]MXN16333.1 hypothetical protein [Pseudooceanicola albus]